MCSIQRRERHAAAGPPPALAAVQRKRLAAGPSAPVVTDAEADEAVGRDVVALVLLDLGERRQLARRRRRGNAPSPSNAPTSEKALFTMSAASDKDAKAARTLSKLEAALASGDFYGALQLYRTIVKRQLDAGAFADAAALVASGVGALARHGRAAEGADLYEMLVKTLDATGAPAGADRVRALALELAAPTQARAAD